MVLGQICSVHRVLSCARDSCRDSFSMAGFPSALSDAVAWSVHDSFSLVRE